MAKKKVNVKKMAKEWLQEAELRKNELSLEIGVYVEQIRQSVKEKNEPLTQVLNIYTRYLVKHYDLLKNSIDSLKNFIGEKDERKRTSTRSISNSGS